MDGRSNRRVREPRLDRRLTKPPLAPSDLRAEPPHGTQRVAVAGRVLATHGAELRLTDAFAQILVRAAQPLEVVPGDLAVLFGSWNGLVLERATLRYRQPAALPRGDGELSRLVLHGVGPRLAARARALGAVRKYFADERFIEVETPSAVPAPGVDRHVEAVAAGPGFFITSPELEMKRLIVGGVPRQFQLARVARRDESGTLHEPEFTLLEWYRAFSEAEHVRRDTEALVRSVALSVAGKAELIAPGGRRIDVGKPFRRITVREAFEQYANVRDVAQLAATDESRYFELLVERVEPALSQDPRPVFLCDYPLSQAALARPCPSNPRYAERFELYVGGVELSNGYGELTDPREQRRRFVEERARRSRAGLPVYPIHERFLDALVEGMPPCSGNALGFDRLVLLATGASALEDVVAFPRNRL